MKLCLRAICSEDIPRESGKGDERHDGEEEEENQRCYFM